MANFKKLIGEKIKSRREALGYSTQSSFAKALEIDQSRVSRWESGESIPDLKYRARLQEILKVGPEFFIGDDSLSDPTPSQSALVEVVSHQQKEIDRLKSEVAAYKAIPSDILEALANRTNFDVVRAALNLIKRKAHEDVG